MREYKYEVFPLLISLNTFNLYIYKTPLEYCEDQHPPQCPPRYLHLSRYVSVLLTDLVFVIIYIAERFTASERYALCQSLPEVSVGHLPAYP